MTNETISAFSTAPLDAATGIGFGIGINVVSGIIVSLLLVLGTLLFYWFIPRLRIRRFCENYAKVIKKDKLRKERLTAESDLGQIEKMYVPVVERELKFRRITQTSENNPKPGVYLVDGCPHTGKQFFVWGELLYNKRVQIFEVDEGVTWFNADGRLDQDFRSRIKKLCSGLRYSRKVFWILLKVDDRIGDDVIEKIVEGCGRLRNEMGRSAGLLSLIIRIPFYYSRDNQKFPSVIDLNLLSPKECENFITNRVWGQFSNRVTATAMGNGSPLPLEKYLWLESMGRPDLLNELVRRVNLTNMEVWRDRIKTWRSIFCEGNGNEYSFHLFVAMLYVIALLRPKTGPFVVKFSSLCKLLDVDRDSAHRVFKKIFRLGRQINSNDEITQADICRNNEFGGIFENELDVSAFLVAVGDFSNGEPDTNGDYQFRAVIEIAIDKLCDNTVYRKVFPASGNQMSNQCAAQNIVGALKMTTGWMEWMSKAQEVAKSMNNMPFANELKEEIDNVLPREFLHAFICRFDSMSYNDAVRWIKAYIGKPDPSDPNEYVHRLYNVIHLVIMYAYDISIWGIRFDVLCSCHVTEELGIIAVALHIFYIIHDNCKNPTIYHLIRELHNKVLGTEMYDEKYEKLLQLFFDMQCKPEDIEKTIAQNLGSLKKQKLEIVARLISVDPYAFKAEALFGAIDDNDFIFVACRRLKVRVTHGNDFRDEIKDLISTTDDEEKRIGAAHNIAKKHLSEIRSEGFFLVEIVSLIDFCEFFLKMGLFRNIGQLLDWAAAERFGEWTSIINLQRIESLLAVLTQLMLENKKQLDILDITRRKIFFVAYRCYNEVASPNFIDPAYEYETVKPERYISYEALTSMVNLYLMGKSFDDDKDLLESILNLKYLLQNSPSPSPHDDPWERVYQKMRLLQRIRDPEYVDHILNDFCEAFSRMVIVDRMTNTWILVVKIMFHLYDQEVVPIQEFLDVQLTILDLAFDMSASNQLDEETFAAIIREYELFINSHNGLAPAFDERLSKYYMLRNAKSTAVGTEGETPSGIENLQQGDAQSPEPHTLNLPEAGKRE